MAGRDPISSDGLLLLQNVLQKNSFTFATFVETWRELNFSLIYWTNTGSERVQRAEITELLFSVGVQYLCNRDDIYSQVAGLFLLYVIFFVQPCQPRILIRLIPPQWATIVHLHSQLQSKKLHGADHALCRLKSNSAFVICCTERPMCLSRWSREQRAELNSADGTGLGVSLQAVGGSMKEYYQIKQQISVYLPQHLLNTPAVSQQMEEVVEDYSQWLANETAADGEVED